MYKKPLSVKILRNFIYWTLFWVEIYNVKLTSDGDYNCDVIATPIKTRAC